jgi:hypothetical protein
MVENSSKLKKLIQSEVVVIERKIDKTPRIKSFFITENKRS